MHCKKFTRRSVALLNKLHADVTAEICKSKTQIKRRKQLVKCEVTKTYKNFTPNSSVY